MSDTKKIIEMCIELIDDIDGFRRIKPAWEKLTHEMGDSVSVFSSYDWYETWWRHYSAGALLHLLIMWEANRLVGIAPLMRYKSSIHGLPVNAVGFIENRNSLHNDFIVLPAAREQFLKKIQESLFEQSALWDIIFLNNLPEPSANHDPLVKNLVETGRKWLKGASFNSPYLILSGSWADYLSSRTTRTRKSLRNIQNSIARTGEVDVRNIRSWDEFQLVKKDIYDVARQSWTEAIGDSLATSVNEAFFDDLAYQAATKGWLSVWTLELNGRLIAFEFHLKGCGRDHAMRGSYLPEFASLSPGTFLEMQILKSSFDEQEKIQKYDFGGSFDNYKRKWAEEAVPHCVLVIFNNNLYSRCVSFHETIIVPLLKVVRDRFKRFKAVKLQEN